MRDLLFKALLNIYKLVFLLLGILLPKNKRLVMFESFLGKQYSDNPRAIYEYMCKHYPDYILYWSVDRGYLDTFEKLDIRYVQRFTPKWIFLMNRAKYWVTNSRLPLWIPKPKNTIYLQTWHGTPLKKLAADMEEVHMPGTNAVQYKKDFLKEVNKWDYLVSPNAYSTKIFKSAFHFEGTMIESGYPRNDFLINHNNTETLIKLKRTLNLSLEKKVILYAPTWRDNQYHSEGSYKFNLQMDLNALKKEFGDNYIILLRLHYLVAENLDLIKYTNFVFDFSNHKDINELYLVSDILVTDYSSVFFDYANLKRPMLFYVYDIENYRDNLRGFYFDFETQAPGPLVRTTAELIDAIKEIDEEEFLQSQPMKDFYNKFCYLEDGNASVRVVREVFEKS